MSDDLDDQTPAQHRARYEMLRANAAARPPVRRAEPLEIPTPEIVWRERIPPGAYTNVRIARGQSFRLIDTGGGAAVAFMAWNADEPSERYNAGDTVKLQWTARLTTGLLLFSDMGRVLASIVADTAGGHDPLIGATKRSGRDNLVLAAAKFGLGVADVPTSIAFFATLRTDENGRFVWTGTTEPGRLVELRAEMNLLVAISNTPHPLDPAPKPGVVDAIVWRSPPASAYGGGNDGGGEEARRGFENTERFFA